MKASRRNPEPIRPAHVLFPPEQAFLWLPAFSGEEVPYCSYNGSRAGHSNPRRRSNTASDSSRNGARPAPPFPVSEDTHIVWHTDVTPPYPYHPVPVAHPLSEDELADLGRSVIELLEQEAAAYPDPIQVLRNQYKSHILAVLARMNLLPGFGQALRPQFQG